MGPFEKFMRLCFSISCVFFIASFCKKQTHGFSISNISSSRPYSVEYETRPLIEAEKNEVDIALNQPYTYFGRGGQAFIFFSEDGNYVLKFFKQRLFRPSWLLNHIPLPKVLHRYRAKRNWKREDKFQRDFFSYKVSFQELLDLTGLLYVHLNPTEHLKTNLTFTDPLHISHTIALDEYDFVVQRRAENTLERIDRCMRARDIDEAKSSIEKILSLVSLRCMKGFRDRDPNLCTNCGFIGDQAVKIDVGRFVRCEEMKLPENHNKELLKIAQPFEKWLEVFHPELLAVFHSKLEEALL